MAESAQDYTKRILEYLNGEEPMAVLSATPDKLGELILHSSACQLARKAAPGKWSVTEILAHLADVEMVVGYRIRMILGHDGIPIQAFNQDAWAEAAQYSKIPTGESLERQRVLRASNLALLRSLSPRQWEHYGLHAERGKENVVRVVAMLAGHDINHLQQIKAALAG